MSQKISNLFESDLQLQLDNKHQEEEEEEK